MLHRDLKPSNVLLDEALQRPYSRWVANPVDPVDSPGFISWPCVQVVRALATAEPHNLQTRGAFSGVASTHGAVIEETLGERIWTAGQLEVIQAQLEKTEPALAVHSASF